MARFVKDMLLTAEITYGNSDSNIVVLRPINTADKNRYELRIDMGTGEGRDMPFSNGEVVRMRIESQ